MSLFGSKEKKEIERLKSHMDPEQVKLSDLQGEIEIAEQKYEKITRELKRARVELAEVKEQIIETDEAALMQSFGLYTPHYSYSTSDVYKEQLAKIREKQKSMIRSGGAVTGSNTWKLNGSASQGKKMVSDMQKLLLRAYNTECDDAIEHVRFNNIAACEKKISSSADAISKLGSLMGISITSQYVSIKLKELYLMHEYQKKKQDEKEELKEARQRQREEAKVLKELAEARKDLEKERDHYENALDRIDAQIAATTDPSRRSALVEKKVQLQEEMKKILTAIKQVDYRAANQRAGYVYIISNIGAFGENVYKIGMTRRLDPMDRIDELGDASVPFDFDVHAMIFTPDAPKLEAALHSAFEDRKVNFVNHRREFFAVTLDEIKKVVKQNFDKTVEFIDIAPAEQYRESLRLKKQYSNRAMRV